jgi:Lipocalin-like domain
MVKRAAMIVALGALFLLPAHARVAHAAGNPLQGAWQVMDPSGKSAGLYIFAGTHYSMMAASTERPDVADLSKATPDELRALYGPMSGNAGTYEIDGSAVTIRPIVAKIPVVMMPGANEVYGFRIEDNTLFLTQQRNARGVVVQNGNTTRLVRVE